MSLTQTPATASTWLLKCSKHGSRQQGIPGLLQLIAAVVSNTTNERKADKLLFVVLSVPQIKTKQQHQAQQ
jgi:hypothetical protein